MQVPPELLLVFSVDQLEHTLVHHVRLEGKNQQDEVRSEISDLNTKVDVLSELSGGAFDSVCLEVEPKEIKCR